MRQNARIHLSLALFVAGGLTVLLWLSFGLRWHLASFLVILGCALPGAFAGMVAGKRLWVTGLVTALIRCALFIGLRGAVT